MYATASGYPKIRMRRLHSYAPTSKKNWGCHTCLYLPGDLRGAINHKMPHCNISDRICYKAMIDKDCRFGHMWVDGVAYKTEYHE
jgi:hypothetical protein